MGHACSGIKSVISFKFCFSDVKDTPLPNTLNEIAEHIK